MRKHFLIVLLLMAVALAACQSSTPTETAAVTEQAANTQPPAATAEPTEPAESAPTQASEDAPAKDAAVRMKCTVESFDPTADPAEESIFPPVTAADWVHGPDNAEVTIIEYSDFQ
jgi:hypothetical protein